MNKRQSDLAFSQELYFLETFAKTKPSWKFPNLQYATFSLKVTNEQMNII